MGKHVPITQTPGIIIHENSRAARSRTALMVESLEDGLDGGVLMGARDGRIDHQSFQVGFACQHRKHVVQHAYLDPAIVAAVSPSG